MALASTACSSNDTAAAPSSTAPASSTTAGGPTAGSDGLTTAELATILPTALDLGEGWADEAAGAGTGTAPDLPISATPDPTEADGPIADQCPELATLTGSAASDPLVRSFVDERGRKLRVEVSDRTPLRSDADLQRAVDATNACDAVALPAQDGITATLRFQAAVDPDHGEQAVKLQADLQLALPAPADPISLTRYDLVLRTGPVGVHLTATDGLDRESLEISRTDMQLLARISDRLEAAADDVAG